MPAIITLAALTIFVTKNAPSWFDSLRGTVLDKGREAAIDKGKDYALARGKSLANSLFHLDEKEQLRHLQQALQNATERGHATFDTLEQRDLYKEILHTLSQPGPQGNTLRREIMQLFTLSNAPNLAALSDLYNKRQRYYNADHQDIDAAPYLTSFFNALLIELYADPYFKQQLDSVLQLRAATSAQQSLLDIVGMLKELNITLQDRYTAQDLARDIEIYSAHIERTLHNLKIVGVVPKDQNSDPELSGIFVPLRVALKGQAGVYFAAGPEGPVPIDHDLEERVLDITPDDQLSTRADLDDEASSASNPDGSTPTTQIEWRRPRRLRPGMLITVLEAYPCLVLLGGPGSGKSTITKYLAWSHAAAGQATLPSDSLLSGNPLPLRIELRRLSEERKRDNYDFLSFTTQVLLKREGIEIDPQMFRELLKRRGMLLLFDGLDEVATMDERRTLVEEIEHFAITYPGNRVLVTSRPVGYDLTRISHPLFAHAEVQSFDDEQIQQFLNNWYTAVLRLSPIPQREQEELDLLLTTVQENPRLHKLAENPLLLTVITVLHRYERLPDRRVLVYDRCADLLLETWARLKGTNVRWKDLRMGKEDQYACVASLGFVLHQRSQEEIVPERNDDEVEKETVDVSSRFLRTNVESYLRKQKSISGGAELRAEAARFIALIQEEAGLIVERGTDENGEPLYSFVHRTFQEYFAASDIYERYLQKEDPKVVSKFLVEHLHDPHWREVIFLLLGKLKSTPVTNQLRNILLYKTKSRRSTSTNILQQDLFFICDCLLEEIKVENTLAEMVRSRLGNIVKSSLLSEQRQEALEYLGKIARTRQYAEYGRKELLALATCTVLDTLTRLKAALTLYVCTLISAKERFPAKQILINLLQTSDLTAEQVIETLNLVDDYDLEELEAEELAAFVLSTLVQRPDLSVEQVQPIAESLYDNSEEGSETQELALETLRALVQRTNLSVEQVQAIAESLARNVAGSAIEELGLATLSELIKRPDLSVEQVREVAESLYDNSEEGSASRELALSTLRALLKSTDLTVGQMQEVADSLYSKSEEGSPDDELVLSTLSTLVGRTDLSIEQICETAKSLYEKSEEGSAARELALSTLSTLVKRTDLSVEQVCEIAGSLSRPLYGNSREGSAIYELVLSMMSELVRRPGLLGEQMREITGFLYRVGGEEGSAARELALSTLSEWVKRTDLAVEQVREIAELLYSYSEKGSAAEELALSTLSASVKRTDLSVEQIQETAKLLYEGYYDERPATDELATSTLSELVKRADLSVEQVWETAKLLYQNNEEGSVACEVATSTLSELVKRLDLSVEQVQEVAESLYTNNEEGSAARELATSTLSELVKRRDLSVEQVWETAQFLYACSPEGSAARELALSTLSGLVKRGDLPVEQVWEIAGSFYGGRAPVRWGGRVRRRVPGPAQLKPPVYRRSAIIPMLRPRRRMPRQLAGEPVVSLPGVAPRRVPRQLDGELVLSLLSILLKRGDLSVEQMRETARLLYVKSEEGSEAQLLATSVLLSLLPQVDKLENKEGMYPILRKMVPQFHRLQQPS